MPDLESLHTNSFPIDIIHTKAASPIPSKSEIRPAIEIIQLSAQETNKEQPAIKASANTLDQCEQSINASMKDLLNMENEYQQKIPASPGDIYISEELAKSKIQSQAAINTICGHALNAGKKTLKAVQKIICSPLALLRRLIPTPVVSLSLGAAGIVAAQTINAESLYQSHKVAADHKNQMLTSNEIKAGTQKEFPEVRRSQQATRQRRLEKIKANQELEKFFGIKNAKNLTLKDLKAKLEANTHLSGTEKKLMGGFLSGLNMQENDTISLESLQSKYADHTIDLSIMAKQGLINLNKQKNAATKKFFSFKKTQEGWKFSLSFTAGAALLGLTSAVMAGISLPSMLLGGLGIVPVVIQMAILTVGLVILSKRAPHQYKEMMKGTYILQALHQARKGFYEFIMRYSSKIQTLEKQIHSVSEQLKTMKISEDEFKALDPTKKTSYIPIKDSDGQNIYVLRDSFHGEFQKNAALLNKLTQKHQKLNDKIEGYNSSIKMYTQRITEANIKDFQHAHGYHDASTNDPQNQGASKPAEWNDFMDEISVIAAADLARDADDQYASDISEILIRQYGVALPTSSGTSPSGKEIYEAVSEGLNFFMGADTERMEAINQKLKQGRVSVQRKVLSKVLFDSSTKNLSEIIRIFQESNISFVDIDNAKKDSRSYRKEIVEKIRKEVSEKMTSSQATQFYGKLWHTLASV